jgi:AraC family transcriptional activator of tynA and feaB
MQPLFSTADVHPRDRFAYWHEVACRNIVNHESRPENRLTFQASIQTGALADIGLIMFENAAMDCTRTPRQIAHTPSDALWVCRQLAGTLVLERNGREVVLNAGDITLIDPQLPYFAKFSSGSRLLLLAVPPPALEARLGSTRQMAFRSIKPSDAAGGLTSSFLAMLPDHVGQLHRAAEDIVREQVLDLLAVSLTTAIGADKPRISTAHSLALMHLRAAIEARLTDPALDPDSVATAAGISVRYANAVLAREGTSIMRLVQARRLSRCRKALEDPLQAHRTLSEIAYSWGFSDMTHFSRKFAAAYGVVPSEYRGLVKVARQSMNFPDKSRPKASARNFKS